MVPYWDVQCELRWLGLHIWVCLCQSRHRRLASLLKVVETESDSTSWAITVRSVGDEEWWLVLSDGPAADGCIVSACEDVVAHEPCPCCTRVGVGNVQSCCCAVGRLCRSGARGSSDGKWSPRSLIVISLAHALFGPKMQKKHVGFPLSHSSPSSSRRFPCP